MLSVMSSKRKLVVFALLALVAGLVILYPYLLVYLSGNKTSINSKSKVFYVKEKTNLIRLAKELKDKGIINDQAAFISVGNYKGMGTSEIPLGKYRIQAFTSYRALLNGFKRNKKGNGIAEIEVELNFNNCLTISDLAKKASKCLLIDSTKLIALLTNPQTLSKYGFTAEQFPAMFIPTTYKFYYDTDEKQFLDRMAREYNDFWTAERKVKMKNIGLNSPSEVVTLASIVYCEQSIVSEEWPIIAGLYLNRLTKGIRMQSDPTFKFCWGDQLKGVQRLLNVHRDIDCAYNTYKIDGLPPGPICFPSKKVVDAVLNRSKVDYIYMCAKPDYSHRHNFALEGAEHMKNAKEFQNWLAEEIKKKESKKNTK